MSSSTALPCGLKLDIAAAGGDEHACRRDSDRSCESSRSNSDAAFDRGEDVEPIVVLELLRRRLSCQRSSTNLSHATSRSTCGAWSAAA